jgi:hypothetical protein
MRDSLLFAENFVSSETVADNFGAVTGTPTLDRGVTLAESDAVAYADYASNARSNIVSVSFEVVIPSAPSAPKIIMNTGYINGFWFAINEAGYIAALHTDSINISGSLISARGITDGLRHTITYSVDTDAGEHKLYVDAAAVVEGASIPAGTVVSPDTFTVGGMAMTVKSVRIFSSVLTATDHADYYNDTLTLQKPLSAWRCDDISDDTTVNKTWDKTPSLNDLTKGDGSTASTFPTYGSDEYYLSGFVEYFTKSFSLPDAYTITAAEGFDAITLPTVEQSNTDTFLNTLLTSGGFEGYLFNLQLFDRVLTAFQLDTNTYNSLYHVGQLLAQGVYGRLVVEDVARLAFFFGQSDWNFSQLDGEATVTGATQTSAGYTFTGTDNIEYPNDSSLQTKEGTIAIYGSFATSTDGTLIENDDLKLYFSGGDLFLNTATRTVTFDSNSQIAVTFKNGYKIQVYVDGENVGESTGAITVADTGTADFRIGNINHVLFADEAFTDEEIKALYERSISIVANPISEPVEIIQNVVASDNVIQNVTTGTDIIQNITG